MTPSRVRVRVRVRVRSPVRVGGVEKGSGGEEPVAVGRRRGGLRGVEGHFGGFWRVDFGFGSE